MTLIEARSLVVIVLVSISAGCFLAAVLVDLWDLVAR